MSVLKGAKSVDNVFRIRRPGGSEKKQGALSVLSLSLWWNRKAEGRVRKRCRFSMKNARQVGNHREG